MANEKDALVLKGKKRSIGFKDGHTCVCGKKIQGFPEYRDHQLKCKVLREEKRARARAG